MSIKSRKLFAILIIAMMMMTLLPMTAFAASSNSVDKVVQVSSDAQFTEATAPVLRIEEKNAGEFSTSGETFRLILENAKFLDDNFKDTERGFETVCEDNPNVAVEVITNTVVEVTVYGDGDSTKDAFKFPLVTEITGEGEATVTIDSRDSAVSSGTYVFANSATGKTIATISKVTTFARTADLEDIQIDETRIGALGTNVINQKIKIKLPPRFQWVVDENEKVVYDGDAGLDHGVKVSGGLIGHLDITGVGLDGERTLVITYEIDNKTRSARGSLFLKGFEIRADRDAAYGDVLADFDGNITAQELVIAEYASYSIDADVAEVKEIVAGRYDGKTAKITVQENLSGAFIKGRELSVVLPEWVKVVEVKNKKASGGFVSTDDIKFETNKNEIYFVIKDASKDGKKSKYEFELELSVEADKSGDIVAEFFGAGMEKQELLIAKAIAPVTAEVAVTDLKIGVQNQKAPDIIITETAKARIDNDTAVYNWTVGTGEDARTYYAVGNENELVISLPTGIEFSKLPTVEVTEGNIELSPAKLVGGNLVIPVKSSSTRPSTIKITDVLLTLDRTVPEGAFNANIGGGSIVKNYESNAVITDPVTFDKGRVIRFHFADVITPAPDETRATTTFTIGSTTYTVVEDAVVVEKTMDVAPYIKAGRTYLPVRFVADALGVTEDNIIWDPVTRSVTVFKGDRIAQMTIGSNVLMVNGVELTMDVAPEITNGRTMLPVRFMTQALGASIAWDAETQTVTVTQ